MGKFDQSPGQDLPTYTVSTIRADNADLIVQLIYVSNGAAGSPVIAFFDGTDWLRCDTLAAVAAA